jgi:hypothetical protein
MLTREQLIELLLRAIADLDDMAFLGTISTPVYDACRHVLERRLQLVAPEEYDVALSGPYGDDRSRTGEEPRADDIFAQRAGGGAHVAKKPTPVVAPPTVIVLPPSAVSRQTTRTGHAPLVVQRPASAASQTFNAIDGKQRASGERPP